MRHRITPAIILLFVAFLGASLAQEPDVKPDRRVQADEIDRYILEKKVFFLDVREPREIEELGTLEGYHNIPVGELEKRLDELPKDRLILTA